MKRYQFDMIINPVVPEGQDVGPFDWQLEQETLTEIAAAVDDGYDASYSLFPAHNEALLHCFVEAENEAEALIKGNGAILSAFIAVGHPAPAAAKISVLSE